MKKIFRKIFILISLFLVFWLNNTFAETRSIEDIKKEIEILKIDFENTLDIKEKEKINIKIWSLVDEFLNISDNVKTIYPLYSFRAYDTCSSNVVYIEGWCTQWYNTLETWDIIVVKSSNPSWWSNNHKVWWWDHAFMIYDNNYILEIKWFWYKSSKYKISDLESRIKNNDYKEIALVRMWLTNSEKNDMKSYINKKLLNKPYLFPSPSNSWAYYCSSLVWKAHKYSGKKIDLDDDWKIVYPIDLITSSNIWEVQHFYY